METTVHESPLLAQYSEVQQLRAAMIAEGLAAVQRELDTPTDIIAFEDRVRHDKDPAYIRAVRNYTLAERRLSKPHIRLDLGSSAD